ncbi:MAG: hypothetical protein U1E65_25470 [Myxococcota bacterium]
MAPAALALILVGAAPLLCEGAGESELKKGQGLDEARQIAKKLAIGACLSRAGSDVLRVQDPKLRPRTEAEERRLVAAFVTLAGADPARVIKGTKIVGEDASPGRLRVRVRATVQSAGARTVLEEARDRVRTMSWPVIGVATDELYLSGDGRTKLGARRDFGRALAAALSHAGYDTVELEYDPGTNVDLLNDPGALARIGREHGAELVIAGEVDVRSRGVRSVHDASVDVEIRVDLRTVDVAAKQVTGQKKLSAKSDGGSIDRALFRAIDAGLAEKAFAELRPLLVKDPGRAAPLRKIHLYFAATGRYRFRGRTVFETVKLIPGITEASVVDTDEVDLELEVSYSGSDERLGAAVLDEAEKTRALSSLELIGAASDQLRFRFTAPARPE